MIEVAQVAWHGGVSRDLRLSQFRREMNDWTCLLFQRATPYSPSTERRRAFAA